MESMNQSGGKIAPEIKNLSQEGDDPIKKLLGELAQNQKPETFKHIPAGKMGYISETSLAHNPIAIMSESLSEVGIVVHETKTNDGRTQFYAVFKHGGPGGYESEMVIPDSGKLVVDPISLGLQASGQTLQFSIVANGQALRIEDVTISNPQQDSSFLNNPESDLSNDPQIPGAGDRKAKSEYIPVKELKHNGKPYFDYLITQRDSGQETQIRLEIPQIITKAKANEFMLSNLAKGLNIKISSYDLPGGYVNIQQVLLGNQEFGLFQDEDPNKKNESGDLTGRTKFIDTKSELKSIELDKVNLPILAVLGNSVVKILAGPGGTGLVLSYVSPEGKTQIETLSNGGSLVIGRDPTIADFAIIGDGQISRAHASISIVGNKIIYNDISTNGTEFYK